MLTPIPTVQATPEPERQALGLASCYLVGATKVGATNWATRAMQARPRQASPHTTH
jgi:hypothetical protein